ncbi:MAG: rhomboid family intramembrane serine protease [Candidatus Zixiibacteriota bacterium]|nr:MAG: rhomboid family intramembrane serine protease [candidate division Zixibacteria bacterium]
MPIKDDAPTYRKPYLTVALIVANSLIFLVSYLQGPQGFRYLVYQFGYIPFELVHGVEITPQLAASTYLTPFTSMFMHGGWMHLIGNMLFLWIYGNNVEDYFGPVKFIFFYVLSGLAAVALYTAFGPNSDIPLVGASGAIAGLMGAYMVLHPRARITVLIIFFFIQFVVLPAKVVLGIWFIIQLFMSFVGSSTGGGVAWMAHVGGFVFGYLVMRILFRRKGGIPPVQGEGQRIYRMDW